jgi:hypothetical protein
MKSSHVAAGLVGLALVGLWYAAGGSNPLPATRAADAPPRVAAPLTHANLSVYLVFGPDAVPEAKLMSLQEALASELAVVHETGNVNTLAIENLSSEYELFVQSGDIVKGGKQDRVVQFDMLLPPNSGAVPLPAHCVEQSRWTGRGQESAAKFDKCEYFAAGRALRVANHAGEQQRVWKSVQESQTKLNDNLKASVNAAASPTSFQLSLESDALREKVRAYEAALKALPNDRRDVIGAVFAVNGQVVSAEVYASNALFRKAWPKLLYASAVEAVSEGEPKAAVAAPSPREVERFLAGGTDAGEDHGLEPNLDATMHALNRPVRDQQNLTVFVADTVDNLGPLNAQQEQTRQANPGAVTNTVAFPGRSGATRAATDNVEQGRARTRLGVRGIAVQNDLPEPAPLAEQTIQTDGNRLTNNRVDNNGTLTVESRDTGRGGAVIHRSYIKK